MAAAKRAALSNSPNADFALVAGRALPSAKTSLSRCAAFATPYNDFFFFAMQRGKVKDFHIEGWVRCQN